MQYSRVTAMEDFLPFSFFENKGALRGVSADVLAKISLRIGLTFDVVRGASMARQIDNLHSGKMPAHAHQAQGIVAEHR